MKTILTTTTSTFLIALLVIGLIGITKNNNINNKTDNSLDSAFAQVDPEKENPPLMEEDKSIGIMTISDHSEPEVNWTGTIKVDSTIGEAFKSKVNVSMIDAIKTSLVTVGLNSTVKEAELTFLHGYLAYKIKIEDDDMKKYKLIVDPGNGEVLTKEEITWCDDDEHEEKMKYS